MTARALRHAWRLLPRELWWGVALLLPIVLLAMFASVLFGARPLSIVADPYLWPGTDPAHWLGTDTMGRDMLTGIAHGARISLLIGLTATALALGLGVSIGVLSGYAGGALDAVLSRLIELFQTMPSMLVAIVVVVVFEPSLMSIAVAIGLASWTDVARIVRAETLRVKQLEFVQAARLSGFGPARILLREVLPNVLGPVSVLASIIVAHAILAEAAIAFLGLGDPNTVSWGGMVGAGREALRSGWYISTIPGIAICLTAFSISLIGNGLNHLLSPRTARSVP